MTGTVRRHLVMEPRPAGADEIAAWLWALEDGRERTLERLLDLDPAVLDWTPPVGGNAIGTLLYHIALIEMDWLMAEVLELTEYPAEVGELFPLDVREPDGRLTPCSGLGLTEHLARLDASRARLLAVFRDMSPEEFRRVRRLRDYDVTPEWVLHHLLQHEAEHRGEIGVVRLLAEQALSVG